MHPTASDYWRFSIQSKKWDESVSDELANSISMGSCLKSGFISIQATVNIGQFTEYRWKMSFGPVLFHPPVSARRFRCSALPRCHRKEFGRRRRTPSFGGLWESRHIPWSNGPRMKSWNHIPGTFGISHRRAVWTVAVFGCTHFSLTRIWDLEWRTLAFDLLIWEKRLAHQPVVCTYIPNEEYVYTWRDVSWVDKWRNANRQICTQFLADQHATVRMQNIENQKSQQQQD